MSVLTAARSGIARSGATRSGYPILSGVRVPLYALSGVARSGATRSNYHSAKVFVAVAGAQVAFAPTDTDTGILARSLTISDELTDTPTTAACTLKGTPPAIGTDVVITLGSQNNLRREFGGTVLHARQFVVGQKPRSAANVLHSLALIDYTWGLSRRKVSARFTSSTVAAIAASLMSLYAPGYTLQVAADIGAESIDEITFTENDLAACLKQLTKRVGGDFLCDYHKVVKLFFEDDSETAPTILNAVHRSLADLIIHRDLSQVVTRCYGEGGGTNALETILPGDDAIPVLNASWYDPLGGVVLCGPQRVTYSSVRLGGRGSLVGTGAAPSSAPAAALATGAGIETGLHEYAATFTTASGESIPGPRVAITVGLTDAPTSAPIASAPTIGTGPDPGAHTYAVTDVTASGETTASPSVTQATTLTPAPTTSPLPGTPTPGNGVDDGTHEYSASFVTPIGETTPGPISAPVTAAHLAAPASAPTATLSAGAGPGPGTYLYVATFSTAIGETFQGPALAVTVPALTPPAVQLAASGPGAGLHVKLAYTWVTANGETTPSPVLDLLNYGIGSGGGATLQLIAVGPTGVIARNVYRTVDGGSQLKFLVTVADNTTTTIVNPSTTDGGLGANAPTVNTAAASIVNLAAIPVGGPTVIDRTIYRTTAGGVVLKVVAALGNNSATTLSDGLTDGGLGANAPTANTAAQNIIPITGIPIGDPTVTARKLYRRSGGLGLKLLATIADNSTASYSDTTPNASLGAAPLATSTAYLQRIRITLALGGTLVTARKVYRTTAGGVQLKLAATIADNVTLDWVDTVTDAGLGANVPTTNTATANQVSLSSLPLGAAAVTGRKIYRTAAGASQLKFLATVAGNVTTTYTDAAADASLGANVPTSDTSLLTQPQGNVLAGSPSLQSAGVADFSPTGGWAIAGTQVIRYTGISGNNLIGIPASGIGSIQATIGFNATVTAAPMLLGIPTSGPGSILYRILKGDPVNLFVQEDDLDAQAALAAQLGSGDGIQEDEIQDRRLSHVEARARARARLELLGARDSEGKVGIITITYRCRDLNTRAGRTIAVNLGTPTNLIGEFLVQRVTQSQFHIPHLMPTFEVEASSVRFSYDALLRAMREQAA